MSTVSASAESPALAASEYGDCTDGENHFHGSGFEFYQGSFLSALHNEQKSSAFGFCAPGEDPAATGCTVPTVPRLVDRPSIPDLRGSARP